jgi:hypothetical protein
MLITKEEWYEITTPYDDGCVFKNKITNQIYKTWNDRETNMKLPELLKAKQQKQQFNQQTKQQPKGPVMAQKPIKKVTGRGR